MTRLLVPLLAALALLAAPAGAQSPNAKSAVGAIGVMRVMPATGKELNVVDQYYKKEPMDDLNKGLFAFASYNAGPRRVAGLRKEAAKRGLDPNVWFNNVERIAAEKIGREAVTYVSNIYKYYVAYTLTQGEYLERMEARKQLLPQK